MSVPKTFSYWVWDGDRFISVSTEKGVLEIVQNPNFWMMDEEEIPLFAGNERGEVLWWGGGMCLYTFPFWNPVGAQVLRSQTLDYLLEDKKPIQLLNVHGRFWAVLSRREKEEKDSMMGVSLLEIDKRAERVIPKILPLQLTFPEAILMKIASNEKGLITFWEKKGKKLALLYNNNSDQDQDLSNEELRSVSPIVSYLTLRGSTRRLLDQLASDQGINSFLIQVTKTESGKTFLCVVGELSEDLPTLGIAQESEEYWVVLSGNYLYSLSKLTGTVSRLDLPLKTSSIRYINFLLGKEGYLLLWRLNITGEKGKVGLMHLPYAK